jgi:succinate dehydrogenase hydrophobic anchor subunit
MRESRFWILHMMCALVILVFLGLHLALMHLSGVLALINPVLARPVAWDHVLARARSNFFTVTYVFMLAAALFHGLYGLRTMLFELTENPALRKAATLVFVAGGFGLFGLGTYALVAMHLMTRS